MDNVNAGRNETQEEPIVTEEGDAVAENCFRLEHILEDPSVVNCLYKCPLCQGKFMEVEQHMSVFHRITLENQKLLRDGGLAATEINVSHL